MSPPGKQGAHAAGAVILAWISADSATSARAAALSGATATKGSPRSAAAASAGSKGTRPRRGMPASRASSAASGPDKSPAMFSTRPRTGAFTWLATVMAFLTTRCETSDGIVTTTVPARRSTSAAMVRSRSVPGGRSSSSRSSSPQLVSVRNSRSALASIEPRQVWASSWVTAFHWRGAESDGSSRSMDITLTPIDVRGGSTPPGARTRRWPRTPSIFAIVGPLRSASRTPTRRPACASEGRHAHRLGADEREARDEERANRDQDRQDPGEVAPREHPALEPPARAVEERGDAHGDQRADAEPEERPAAHREDRELQMERGDPVHDAVAEVRPRGLVESSLDRGHGRDGRNRPPHFARTSAKSSRVTTASPRPRA